MHSDKYVYTQAVPQTESELAAIEADETIETQLFPVSGQGQKLEFGTPAIAVLQSADCSKISTSFNVASKNFVDNSARLRSARSESLKPRKSVSNSACASDTWCLQTQRSTATAIAATKTTSRFQQKLLDSLKTAEITDLDLDVHHNDLTPEAKTKSLKLAVAAITACHRMTRATRSKSTGPLSTSCQPFLTTELTRDNLHVNLLAAQTRLYLHFFDDGKVPLVDENSSSLRHKFEQH